MTPKQARFVEEYLIDLNGSAAYRRAGYAVKSDAVARAAAARLLASVNVSHAVQEAIAARSARTEITQDYIVTSLQEVAQRCLQRVPVMVFNRAERCMVQATNDDGNGVWQFDSTGANRSLELLGKHLGIFNDKLEHSGSLEIIHREVDSWRGGDDGDKH